MPAHAPVRCRMIHMAIKQLYYWLRLLGWNLVERAHTAFCSCGRLG